MAKKDMVGFRNHVSSLAAIVMMLSCSLRRCHAQWSFPGVPALPPSPSSGIDGSDPSPADWTDVIPTTPAAAPVPTTPTTPTTSTTLIVAPFSSPYFDPLTFYDSVQAAIDAVPENNMDMVTIQILPGTYTEKVTIPSRKPFITMQGAGRGTTIISYNDTDNSTGSTRKSATTTVLADNFIARNITFQNSAPHATAGESGAQAVAIRTGGDMAAFFGCGFVSSQDTIYDEKGRHYFWDCYIQGNIDIIWGNGQSLYEYCEIQSTADNSMGMTGCITAQSRTSGDQPTGFVFVGGSITGTGTNLLGRGYGAYSRVLFIDTSMDDIIDPSGWGDWPKAPAFRERHYYYGEHGNFGPGADLSNRVSWMMTNLTDTDAANFSSLSFIDGNSWLTSHT